MVTDMGGKVVMAAMWRLAAEAARRHPTTTLLRAGGVGGTDVEGELALCSRKDQSQIVFYPPHGVPYVRSRFDTGEGGVDVWPDWSTWAALRPRDAMGQFEAAVGLNLDPPMSGH